MWSADKWNDYEILDTSKGEKLERWGEFILVRPDPQVIWDTPRRHVGWEKRTAITTGAAGAAASGNFLTCPSSGASAISL